MFSDTSSSSDSEVEIISPVKYARKSTGGPRTDKPKKKLFSNPPEEKSATKPRKKTVRKSTKPPEKKSVPEKPAKTTYRKSTRLPEKKKKQKLSTPSKLQKQKKRKVAKSDSKKNEKKSKKRRRKKKKEEKEEETSEDENDFVYTSNQPPLKQAIDLAIGKMNFKRIQTLCKKFKLTDSDKKGQTLLYVAASVGFVKLVKYLLISRKNKLQNPIDVDQTRNDHTTPLVAACCADVADGSIEEYEKCVEMLLKADAKTNLPEENNLTALYRAIGGGDSRLKIVEMLVQHSQNEIKERRMFSGKYITPLIYALETDPPPWDIVQLLLERSCSCRDLVSGRSALGIAAEFGKTHHVQLMLDQDVDPDLKDDNGMTPLMRACASRRHDVVRLLLDYKVETNSKDNDGRNALHHACRVAYDDSDGYVNSLEMLLPFVDNINLPDYKGYTPLLHAAESGKIEVIRFLLDDQRFLTPDLHVQTLNKSTITHCAVLGRDFQSLKLVIMNGAAVDEADIHGDRPLTFAVVLARDRMVKFLLDKGALKTAYDLNIARQIHKFFSEFSSILNEFPSPPDNPFKHNSKKLGELLLKVGTDPSTKENRDIARNSTQKKLFREIRELLENGADPESPLEDNQSDFTKTIRETVEEKCTAQKQILSMLTDNWSSQEEEMGGLENDNPPRDDDEESSDDETQDSMHTIVARVESTPREELPSDMDSNDDEANDQEDTGEFKITLKISPKIEGTEGRLEFFLVSPDTITISDLYQDISNQYELWGNNFLFIKDVKLEKEMLARELREIVTLAPITE